MDNDQSKSEMKAQYVLPYGMRRATPLYMVVPNADFYNAWAQTAPVQADKDYILRNRKTIGDIKHTLSTDPDFKQELPHIGIDIVNGKTEVSFVNGIRRFTALKQMGEHSIPALIETNTNSTDLLSLSFIEPVPPELLAKLYGDTPDSLARTLAELDKDPEIIKSKIAWAKSPEGATALIQWFIARGLGAITAECLEYYQQHGNAPPEAEIEQMKQQALAKLRMKLEAQGREVITEAYFAYHQRYGTPPSEDEMKAMERNARINLRFKRNSPSHDIGFGRGGGMGGR